jgi:signal peptidase II
VRVVQERGTAPPLSDRERRRRGALRRLLVASSVAAGVVAADQLTKSWAVNRLAHGPVHVVWKLDLELTYNSGSAFSLARGWAPILAGLALVAVLVLLTVVRRVHSSALAVALGLVVGGALGNLSDRAFRSSHGSVVDFIALHFWPTFNVADSCVVVGGIVAALLLWRGEGDAAPATSGHRTDPGTP